MKNAISLYSLLFFFLFGLILPASATESNASGSPSVSQTAAQTAAQPVVGVLTAPSWGAKPGAESDAAWAMARQLRSETARQVSFDDDWSGLNLIWIHVGDAPAVSMKKSGLQKLKKFVESGGGLYLSGASWPLLNRLGVEPLSMRSAGGGDDSVSAGIVPMDESALFAGLTRGDKDGNNPSVIYLTDGGYSAFSDFHGTGGPAGGALRAKSATGQENPICEYALGKGRIVAVGWRLTNYRKTENVYRGNLVRLTANIFSYLSAPGAWQEIVLFNQSPNPAFVVGADGDTKVQPVTERDCQSLRLAIEDLIQTYPNDYPNGAQYLKRLDDLQTRQPLDNQAFADLKTEALLANPLMRRFDRFLAVRRAENNLGLPANWESDSSLPHTGYGNEIVSIPVQPDADGEREPQTVYRPAYDEYVGELDLHFNADRLLFSQPALRQAGGNDRWQLFEYRFDENKARVIETIPSDDVDNYDGCYLPDGRLIFTSTAPMIGVPCVRGSSHVTNTYVRYPDGRVRQLTFDQEHNWNPTVMPNGRIMYLRWEYTDIPHAFYRLLFTMNPDGTNQVEYYGSNSYWPNSMFNAKPCPGAENRFYAVVVGHHDTARAGELVLFDAGISNFEADGAVQKIGQRGRKVEPTILDGLTGNAWPKFLHPAPLSDKYVLTACKPSPSARWGIYLVDVFDNFLLLYDEPGCALLEPIPFQKTPCPPAIADRTDPESSEATVFLADIYSGPGLRGIERGAVKQLRLFTYDFSYHGMGGQVDRVGFDGPWDVRAVIGTVPVEEDGSASFTVPANVPIALQPLDKDGAALQLMRSWFTAMPGEVVSCVGCHTRSNLAPITSRTAAANRVPSAVKPFYGPMRGFSFRREVQPVLDKYCVGCHREAAPSDAAAQAQSAALPVFRPGLPQAPFSLVDNRTNVHVEAGGSYYNDGTNFSQSYLNLRRFVRGHTIEADCHLLMPREFHVNTIDLFQTLRAADAHFGVAQLLSREDWDRLTTWVDMNTPFHGTWNEISGPARTDRQASLRKELRQLYAGIDLDQEAIAAAPHEPVVPVFPSSTLIQAGLEMRRQAKERSVAVSVTENSATEVTEQSADASGDSVREAPEILRLPLSEDQSIEFVRIPTGTLNGLPTGGFWMSRREITNRQYQSFDPDHDSRYEFGDFLCFSLEDRGFPTNGDAQPVLRVSYQQARQFCRWLSDKTGRTVALPSAIQWEFAARAGNNSPDFYFGDLDTDFSVHANLSDQTNFSIPTYRPWSLPSGAISPWRPAETRFNDGYRATAPVGTFRPNRWGLFDMFGNVAEWVAGSDAPGSASAVGGSFNSRPQAARFGAAKQYPLDQPVYDIGFRIILTPKDGF